MSEPISADQARMNAVIAQRNTALNAVAEHEAMLTVMAQNLEAVTKERDELKAKCEPSVEQNPAEAPDGHPS